MRLLKKYASMADYKREEYEDKIFLFQLIKRKSNPSFSKSDGKQIFYPTRSALLLIDQIYDKDAKKRREIKYAEGIQTIFVDKQNKDIDIPKRAHKAVFMEGIFTVSGEYPELVKFMMRSNFNQTNPERDSKKLAIYSFVDKGKQFREVMEKDKTEQEAISWCYSAPFKDLLGYGRVLLGPDIEQMDSAEVRFNMKSIASKNPKSFMTNLKSPLVKRKQHVYEAIDRGILTINTNTNSIAWSDNPRAPLATAPIGAQIIDHFIEITLTPEGEGIYSAIKDFLDPTHFAEDKPQFSTPIPITSPEPPKPTESELSGDTMESIEKLVDKAIELEVVETKKSWHYFDKWKAMGKQKFISQLKGNKSMLVELKKEVANA